MSSRFFSAPAAAAAMAPWAVAVPCPLRLLLALPVATLAQAGLEAVSPFSRQLAANGVFDDPATLIPNTSADIVGGLVEAFLHKQQLPKDELDCLVNGTADLTGTVMQVASHMVVLTQEVLGMRDDSAAPPLPAVPLEAREQEPQEPGKLIERRRLGDEFGGVLDMAISASQLIIDLGQSIQKIALLTHSIMQDCIHGDAKRALLLASKHLRDPKYISGHFMANGADIANEIGSAVDHWNNAEYWGFGHSVGTALRKVVLSNATSDSLPEGPPSRNILGNITVGLADGLLGKGFALDVTMFQHPEDPLHIDLRTCVGKNLFFFQSAWSATIFFFAQQAAQNQNNMDRYKDVKSKFGNQLAFTMMQIPHALKTCNIDHTQEEALMDSVKAFGSGMSIHFELPGGQRFSIPQAEAYIGRAMDHWAKSEWYAFGFEIGKLLQLLVIAVFPQKWSVASTGQLQQQLLEVDSATRPMLGQTSPNNRAGAVLAVISLLMLTLLFTMGRRAVILVHTAQGGTAAQAARLEDIEDFRAERAGEVEGRDCGLE